jgi:hypothetical protein
MTDGHRFSGRTGRRDNNTHRSPTGQLSGVTGIIAKLRAALKSRVPLGYEDETGFHTGAIPSEE